MILPNKLTVKRSLFSTNNNTTTTGVTLMTTSMCLHFGSYEWVRSAALTQLSPTLLYLLNASTGIVSLLLLDAYNRILQRKGPQIAILTTTLLSSLFFFLQPFLPPTAPLLYLVQSTYQYLLYEQQWSFITSNISPKLASKWFGRITAIGLICSTLTASLTPKLGNYALCATSVALLASAFCSYQAYQLCPITRTMTTKSTTTSTTHTTNTFQTLYSLFQQNQTLRFLLFEGLAFSCLTNVSQYQFLSHVHSHSNPTQMIAHFYTTLNAMSALWQLLGVPLLAIEPRTLWRILPVMALLGHFLPCCWLPPLYGLVKFLDYAGRSVLVPIVYQPLDFEARYLGKEAIGMVGSRVGKSGMALVISFLSQFPQFTTLLPYYTATSVGFWWLATRSLASVMPTRAQAEAIVQEQRQQQHKKE